MTANIENIHEIYNIFCKKLAWTQTLSIFRPFSPFSEAEALEDGEAARRLGLSADSAAVPLQNVPWEYRKFLLAPVLRIVPMILKSFFTKYFGFANDKFNDWNVEGQYTCPSDPTSPSSSASASEKGENGRKDW